MKINAFTLAEVLITLGIIGIAVTMTLSGVISKTQQNEASARLKKFYSAMSQAIMFSESENGSISEWGKLPQVIEDGIYNEDENSKISDAFFRKYLAQYLKFVSAEKDPDFAYYTKVVFADGSTMHVRNGGCYDLYFDANGDRKPNTTGKDQFWFIICSPNEMAENFWQKGIHFGPYAPKTEDRATALNNCMINKDYCGRLLQIDNWEFKEDYPG